MSNMRILFLDIETAPARAYVWKMWKENIPPARLEQEWYVLSFTAKWAGEDGAIARTLTDYPVRFKRNPQDDFSLLSELHALLDEADVVVAHNGKGFDIPKVNTRFLFHKMAPPSPFKVVDTLLVARRNFKVTFNSLSYLAKFLNLPAKMDSVGFDVWLDCMAGKPEAFELLRTYNIQDVIVLEAVYGALLPWTHSHPNHGLYTEKAGAVCDKCGSSHIQWRGSYRTNTLTYRRFQCQGCGGWGRSRTAEKRIVGAEVTVNAVR